MVRATVNNINKNQKVLFRNSVEIRILRVSLGRVVLKVYRRC